METEFQKNQAIELKAQISQLEDNLDKKDDALEKIQFKESQDDSKSSTNCEPPEKPSVVKEVLDQQDVKPKTPAQIGRRIGFGKNLE